MQTTSKVAAIVCLAMTVIFLYSPVRQPVHAAAAVNLSDIRDLSFDEEYDKTRYRAKDLNQLKYENAAQVIGLAIKGLMMFMGAIMFILVVYAGFLWMTAQGNGEKVDQAKNIIVWATLGVGIMLVSNIVVQYLFTDVLNPVDTTPTATGPAAPSTNAAAVQSTITNSQTSIQCSNTTNATCEDSCDPGTSNTIDGTECSAQGKKCCQKVTVSLPPAPCVGMCVPATTNSSCVRGNGTCGEQSKICCKIQ